MRTFVGFGQVPYIGVPQSIATKLGGLAAQVVPLLFQWISYGAASSQNINVLVDLRSQNCVRLDQIRSVYIDNLGSNVPVYVYFPDTNYTVVAKPNSEGWYPCFTNTKVFWVIGEGFTSSISIPQTSVIASNIYVPPSVNTELDNGLTLFLASSTISRGGTIYNQNFGTPALGDQTQQVAFVLSVGNVSPNLFLGPYPSGFIYLTALTVTFDFLPTGGAPGSPVADIVFESTGISGVIYEIRAASPKVDGINNFTAYNLSNKNIKLDATQTWRFRSVTNPNSPGAATGQANCSVDFTVNPF